MTFVDSGSWLGSFQRSLSGEGRKSLMVHLNSIIQQAITAITEYQDTEFCKLIVNHLAQAKIGINNLSTTYQTDANIVAQINVCVANIDLQLEKNRNLLEGHQTYSAAKAAALLKQTVMPTIEQPASPPSTMSNN
jgi:predicted TIM-barrel fold metal-dependent hydrolase